MSSPFPVVLLGPQRFEPNLREIIEPFAFDRPFALITAGWQEREEEIQELDAHLQHQTIHLYLHQRSERLFALHPDYRHEYRKRQSLLRRAQQLYSIQLEGVLEKARYLMRYPEESKLLEPAVTQSIQLVRQLDEMHQDQIRQIHREFRQAWPLSRLPRLQAEREEIEQILGRCCALLIAGGHVVVLLNRIRLFGVERHFTKMAVFGWSAGAMVLTDRIVLFHDSPPQGQGNPEILEQGFGLVPNLVALPHASKRLRLNDPNRVALFARRFDPALCVALDPHTAIMWDGKQLKALKPTRYLAVDGELGEVL
ncbi:MAG: Type 1 glutamine amidotransferase-like domain-containing protein [Acidobacteria bacterium]|nr:Type 1 glutamine amidotransferase-like domain-containing protein [Acidobacteriota bacterium]MCB9397370.1 Type 1 glutamine amidotransferase-like domain-containing protein [Acidobacteriota bacterium]